MHVLLASWRATAPLAAVTAHHAARTGAQVRVVDVDGTFPADAPGVRLSTTDLGVDPREMHRRAMLAGMGPLADWLVGIALVAAADDVPVVVVRPGTMLEGVPDLVATTPSGGLGLIPRVGGDGREWPGTGDAIAAGPWSPSLVVARPDQRLGARWVAAATVAAEGRSDGDAWLAGLAAALPHVVDPSPSAVLSAWSLTPRHTVTVTDDGHLSVDGVPVAAVDLTGLDPDHPSLLDARAPRGPRARLSDHPALREYITAVTAEHAARRAEPLPAGAWDPTTTAYGVPVHPLLRRTYLEAEAQSAGREATSAPDAFDPAEREASIHWLTDPADGVGRYLLTLHRSRPDVAALWPDVPGKDTRRFLAWARTHAAREDAYPGSLVAESVTRALAATATRPRRRAPGVTVVGFVSAELGIGESARLMASALEAAGVPHGTVPVTRNHQSRVRPTGPRPPSPHYDTTLICVNADLTPTVARSAAETIDGSYRIGMWYWEVEEFPATQHAGFAHVDEIWVATDFIAEAIRPHAPVPVRVVTPPLPQRGPDPSLTRADLGLPAGRPVFLFSFDFLSTVERKNPEGVLEAFRRAFPAGTGDGRARPVLVLKSMNADARPAEAERLRIEVGRDPDVVLLEEYLEPDRRDALVALCDCFVSLHRSEGLGLTMAEAMARGKPVIATGYSGNLQFMTDENSFLVPWRSAPIPEGAAPYPPGGRWAEPDLDAAAELMRLVVDDPETARARGERGAADIAARHDAAAAGRHVAEALAASAGRRRGLRPRRAVAGLGPRLVELARRRLR